MMRLRVAVVVESGTFGSTGAYARNLLRWLPSWCRCALLVSEPVVEHFARVRDAVEVVPLPEGGGAAGAADALARLRPDVVQVNLSDPASGLACLEAAVRAAPTVVTLHLPGSPPAGPFPPVAYAIAPSASVAAQLRRELMVPPSRVVRVRHGVEPPAHPVTARAVAIPVVVGAVARLTARKGLDLLLEAARELVADGCSLEVRIAGAGDEEDALRGRAAGLPVRFTGQCLDVPAFLRELDVFCLPSRREALPLALLEAAAHGLPCVSTAVGDVAEVLTGAASIVPADDGPALTAALRALVDDPALRAHLGARARARALRAFDVRMMAARTAAVLAQAVRRPLPLRG
ncbi:glycosyltransferase family 4 protein [Saccharothrix coeruleofusca]|uniref:Glycosyltransferase subfamily 4-like N-terminal domain-containing protein n=1 Tax=Saccharothrix coeruleofusca TaxID=33919 RepID=A0A918ASC5_9PSEU|nr:glycosyltransferase family 4 protein [Saccharothrix coeruleofusca]MBP2335891.1 glycosyltransferase involved in cell wall biosynthesis [Saccharothrix coeruleofusca]GGP76820.1 hypothetical protein GCM10010185_58250 [Saccharothrix coeruleofusca]